MKKDVLLNKAIIQQSNFNIISLKSKNRYKIFTIIKSDISLIFKSSLIIDILSDLVKIEKKYFFVISGYSNKKIKIDNISNITYKDDFIISLDILNIIRYIKYYRLENIFDFFNWPVKFNVNYELGTKEFLFYSLYGI